MVGCFANMFLCSLLTEALNTRQKELHKELSALRAELQSVSVMAPSSNMSLVQWKVRGTFTLKRKQSCTNIEKDTIAHYY